MLGIGITTRNRFKILEYTLSRLKQNLPSEHFRLVIVDDCSENPELIEKVCIEYGFDESLWYNEERLGIAKSKNKCLELLGECDHYFLCDDDLYIIDKGFWKVVIDSRVNHCIYAKDKALNGQIKRIHGSPAEMHSGTNGSFIYDVYGFESGTGCLIYFTKEVVDKLGGFNEGYQIYGNEHNGHSYRIFKAGLTPAPYISIKGLDRYVRCLDIDGLPIGVDIPFGSVDSGKQKAEQLKDIRSHIALHKDRCYSYYQPLQPDTDKIKLIGWTPKNFGGCIYFRQLMPHTVLSLSGFDYEYFENFDKLSDEQIKSYDAVVIQKASMPVIPVWERLKKLGIYIIFDLDDWIDIPENHRLYDDYNKNHVYDFMLKCISMSDMLTCTTELLAYELKKLHPNVHVFENAVDPEMEQFKIKPQKSDKFRFGYFGGLCHKPDVELLRPVLSQLSSYANCKGKFEMILYGYVKNTIYDEYGMILSNGSKIPLKTGSWQHVFNYISGYNTCDCSLVPLRDDFFNSMKSELKLVEAGFMHKAIIVSNVEPYLSLGRHEHNCLMVNNTDEWIQAMKLLIHEPEYALELGENLYNDVKDKYNIFSVNERRKVIYKEKINEFYNRSTK